MTGGRKGPDSSKKIGSRYEQAAADFLQDRGYKILERKGPGDSPGSCERKKAAEDIKSSPLLYDEKWAE